MIAALHMICFGMESTPEPNVVIQFYGFASHRFPADVPATVR